MHNKTIHMVTFLLVIVGGLNWLLHAFGFNLVNILLGSWPMLEKVVYILVGLSAVYELVTHKGSCTHCGAGGGHAATSSDSGM